MTSVFAYNSKLQTPNWITMVFRDVLLLNFIFYRLYGVACLLCYVGDWSKSAKMAVVDCEFQYCGIMLRQNGSGNILSYDFFLYILIYLDLIYLVQYGQRHKNKNC